MNHDDATATREQPILNQFKDQGLYFGRTFRIRKVEANGDLLLESHLSLVR